MDLSESFMQESPTRTLSGEQEPVEPIEKKEEETEILGESRSNSEVEVRPSDSESLRVKVEVEKAPHAVPKYITESMVKEWVEPKEEEGEDAPVEVQLSKEHTVRTRLIFFVLLLIGVLAGGLVCILLPGAAERVRSLGYTMIGLCIGSISGILLQPTTSSPRK